MLIIDLIPDRAHVAVLGATADEAALGGDHEVVRIGVQGFADELLVGVRAVDVGGVNEGHAFGDHPAQQRNTRSWSGYSPQTFGPVSCMAP
jgi:hypothetical protein